MKQTISLTSTDDKEMPKHPGSECLNQNFSSTIIDANRTALLIIDVQPEYWSDAPGVRQDFDHFPDRLTSLIEHCRSQGSECVWVRADYNYEKSPWLRQFHRLHEGRIPPVVVPSNRWEPFAQPQPGENIILKSSWSATTDTNLVQLLKDRGVDTVLVCGLITSVCVQHSAFGIFQSGFRTILVQDCCADRGVDRHNAALRLYGNYMYELSDAQAVRRQLFKISRNSAIEEALTASSTAVSQSFKRLKRHKIEFDSSMSATSLSSIESLAFCLPKDDAGPTHVSP